MSALPDDVRDMIHHMAKTNPAVGATEFIAALAYCSAREANAAEGVDDAEGTAHITGDDVHAAIRHMYWQQLEEEEQQQRLEEEEEEQQQHQQRQGQQPQQQPQQRR